MRTLFRALVLLLVLPLTSDAQETYVPSTAGPSGVELVAVFVTAEFCAGSGQPHMPGTIERMKLLLAEQAAQSGLGLSVVGVSLDWDTQEGVDHLAKFGAFDEISVGRNWFGSGAIRFIWRDLPGESATPQVLLLRRGITTAEGEVRVSAEEEIRRLIGADDIEAWVEAGAPIDT
jgi:hypothetical protein